MDTTVVQNGTHKYRHHLHPTASALLLTHDQSSWAITDDKLICAPVGFYRVMEQYGEDDPAKALAFGFNPEDLDLVPHPSDPTRKVLKNPSFILDPIEDTYIQGQVENLMHQHQGQWLSFVLGFGNLYYTDNRERDRGEYYSNNFISYGMFQEYNEVGQPKGYRITYRVNPFGKEYGLGLNQNKNDTLWDAITQRGVLLKHCKTRDEGLQYIHDDIRKRLPALIDNMEVQLWGDNADQFHNMAMWCYNQASHIKDEPISAGTALSKLAELVLTKLTLGSLAIEAGMETLEERADEEREQELHGTELDDIAYVKKPAHAPLYLMKEGARESWVSVDNPDPLFATPLPACHDLEAYRRARALDVIHGQEPVMITEYGRETGQSIISARTHQGMEVHYLNRGNTRYVTYAPSCATASSTCTALPFEYKSLFSQEGIAVIERKKIDEPIPEGAKIFHELPSDKEHRLIYSFKHLEEVTKNILNDRFLQTLQRHRTPVFQIENREPLQGSHAEETKSLFRRCADALVHYGALLSPFTDAKDPEDCWRAWAAAGLGGLTVSGVFGTFLIGGAPWAFAVAAGLMTKRLAANALTSQGAKNLHAAAHTLFALGPILFLRNSAPDMLKEAIQETHKFFMNAEAGESILGLLSASWVAVTQIRRAFATTKLAFNNVSRQSSASRTIKAPRPSTGPLTQHYSPSS